MGIGNTIYQALFGNNDTTQSPYAVMVNNGGGYTKSGQVVSPEDALKETTVMSCINIIGQGLAQLPLVTPGRDNLFREPNPYQTSYEFIYSIVHSLLAYGNAYVRLVRGKNGKVVQMTPLNPKDVKVLANAAGIPQYMIGEKQEPISYRDVVHIKDVSTFEVQGRSKVELCAERIGALKAADALMANTFRNGPQITTVFSSDGSMDVDQKESFLKGIKDKFTSGGTQPGGAMYAEGINTTQLKGSTPADADLRELRSHLIREIAGIFRVPPYMVGGDGDQKYSNVRQAQTGLYRDTFLPIITCIEQAFVAKMGGEFKFNVDGLLKGDAGAQTDVVTKQLSAGMITINEARAYSGIPPIEGGDEFSPRDITPSDNGTVDEPNATDNPNSQEEDDEEE